MRTEGSMSYKHKRVHYSGLTYGVSLQRAVGSAECINDSCLPCQNIMCSSHMEPMYKGTFNWTNVFIV